MTPLEAMRVIKAAATFIRACNNSPEEALGLEEAVIVLITAATEVKA